MGLVLEPQVQYSMGGRGGICSVLGYDQVGSPGPQSLIQFDVRIIWIKSMLRAVVK